MATTHTYPPVGHCIYCGRETADLGDEHIIPYSLNGGMVLPDASCHECERIIQRYEQTVARNIFGHFRIRYEVQSRGKEKHKRPTQIQIGTLLPDGRKGKAYIPISEFPMLILYKYNEATFLQGVPPDVVVNTWIPYGLQRQGHLETLVRKYHWDRKVRFVAYPDRFARMLAKIAYSFAVAEIGLDSFHPLPMTLDTILCRTDNVCHVVGGELELPPVDPAGKHILNIGTIIRHPNPLVVVWIRLFPAFETPCFHVVVGYFDSQNAQHVKKFSEKMQEVQWQKQT